MLTLEQIREIQAESREKGISIKTILEGKGVPSHQYFRWKRKYSKQEVAEGFLPVSGAIPPAVAATNLIYYTGDYATTYYMIKTQSYFNSDFDSGTSTLTGYYPISTDYYGYSFSGTITTIGCEVVWQDPANWPPSS